VPVNTASPIQLARVSYGHEDRNSSISRRATIALLAAIPLWLLACANDEASLGKRLTWSETVQVSLTERLVLNREMTFTVSHPWGEETGGIDQVLESKLAIENPGQDLANLDTIRLTPILLARDSSNRELVLVATTDSCVAWAMNGKPSPAYWAFRMRSGVWYLTEVPPSFFGRPSNLLVDIRPSDEGVLAEKEVDWRKSQASASARIPARFGTVRADGVITNCDRTDAGTAESDFVHMGKQ
jgi:hypothetical protein